MFNLLKFEIGLIQFSVYFNSIYWFALIILEKYEIDRLYEETKVKKKMNEMEKKKKLKALQLMKIDESKLINRVFE